MSSAWGEGSALAFKDKLAKAEARNQSLLCVGLDPFDVAPELVLDFNRAIVEATSDLVCAYKPNLAIYEGMGTDGMAALQKTLDLIPDHIPVIGDGKRGDIEKCGEAYAERLFGTYDFDAVTVNPYMAIDAVQPFLAWEGRGVFVLCRTSNRHSGETQHLRVISEDGTIQPLYLEIARLACQWDAGGNIGLVMGATYPEELRIVRERYPNLTLLIPGVGAQGGSLQAAVQNAADANGGGFILSVSRSLIFAQGQPSEVGARTLKSFAAAANTAAKQIREEINDSLAASLVAS